MNKKFKRLRGAMLNHDLTAKDLCSAVGMNQNTFSLRVNGRYPFTATEMRSIAKVLDIPPSEYYSFFIDGAEGIANG